MRPITAFVTGVVVTIAVPLVSALVFFKMGLVAVNADASPGWVERQLAGLSREASIARNAPRTDNPVAATDETLRAAVTLYKDNCAGCHGGSQGPSDFGLAFYPPAPQFVNRKRPFGDTDGELFYVIKHGIRLTGMPAFGGQKRPLLKDEEIWGLVRFLKTMQSLPPSVAEEWRGHPTTAPSGTASASPAPAATESAAPAASGSPAVDGERDDE